MSRFVETSKPRTTTRALIVMITAGLLTAFRVPLSQILYGAAERADVFLIIAAGLFLYSLGIFVYMFLSGDLIFPFLKEIESLKVAGLSVQLSPPPNELVLKDIISDLKELSTKVERNQNELSQLPPEHQDTLVKNLKLQLQDVVANDIVKQIESKYSTQIAHNSQVTQIRSSLESTKKRLTFEVASLSRRNILNLTIGAVTTALAVGMLAYLVLGANQQTFGNLPDLLAHFIPRVSIAAFIEVFSFFFLKLYRSGLQEIKYFQNELTNVEMKTVALEASLLSAQNKAFENIIPQLASTDRNHALLIADKSVGDSAGQISSKDLASLVEAVGKIINSGGSK